MPPPFPLAASLVGLHCQHTSAPGNDQKLGTSPSQQTCSNPTMLPKELFTYNNNCRRDPSKVYYKPDLRLLNEGCTKGMDCPYGHAHTKHEIFYHPLNYKTGPCAKGRGCMWGRNCAFIHDANAPDEKRIIDFWEQWRKEHSQFWRTEATWEQWTKSGKARPAVIRTAPAASPASPQQKLADRITFALPPQPTSRPAPPPVVVQELPYNPVALTIADIISSVTDNGTTGGNSKKSKKKKKAAAADSEALPPLSPSSPGTSPAPRQAPGLLYITGSLIGKGSSSAVYKGLHQDWGEVAIKKFDASNQSVATLQREFDVLVKASDNPHIVSFRGREIADDGSYYLALELCDCSLQDVFGKSVERDPTEIPALESFRSELRPTKGPPPALLHVIQGVLDGVAHLHSLGYVHCDLKPSNVLLKRVLGRIEAKLSDFGISKLLPQNQQGCPVSMQTLDMNTVGSFGWMAPELLRKGAQKNTSIDIYSLGLLIFYCLTDGYHPFLTEGDSWFEVCTKMSQGQADLERLRRLCIDALFLVTRMLNLDPARRPAIAETCVEPLFWKPDQKLQFLFDFGEYLAEAKLIDINRERRQVLSEDQDVLPFENEQEGLEDASSYSELARDLEAEWVKKLLFADEQRFPKGMNTDWREVIHLAYGRSSSSVLWEHMKQYTFYSSKIKFLVRFVRNLLSHKRHIHASIAAQSGPLSAGPVEMVLDLFPALFICCFEVVRKYCQRDFIFVRYFEKSTFGNRPLATVIS
eukprot:TRINITY_DN6209_c0_g1_i1.p1 TRINITY_DN6209_c0_g1~~TRINITY_DN6209_c0_g1_i1.p1  ORF type:complete len:752 (-),score=141.34 TRINITY_DN6209_c0_g1_i1:11-2266(-)